MYKIMNNSQRSFIVQANEVIKGGTKFHERDVKDEKDRITRVHDIKLVPSNTVIEVTDKLGKELSGYAGIIVVDIVKEKKGK